MGCRDMEPAADADAVGGLLVGIRLNEMGLKKDRFFGFGEEERVLVV